MTAAASRVASAGVLVAGATTLASAANFGVTALSARMLDGPGFAGATVLVAVFTVLGIGAVALQLAAARAVAVGERGVLSLARSARRVGLAATLLLALAAPALSGLLHLRDPLPVVVLAAAAPVYLMQAVHRGVLQGRFQMGVLAASFLAEAAVRLALTTAFLALGLGVVGVALGLVCSVLASWAVVRPQARYDDPDGPARVRVAVGPALALMAGQAIACNGDVLVVQAVLPDQAPGYFAVALIGRVVFFLSWSAVSVIFPLAARRGLSGTRALGVSVGVAAVAGTPMVIGAALFAPQGLGLLLGAGHDSLAGLLWRYALATMLLAALNAVAALDLATGRRRGPRLLLVVSFAQLVVLAQASSPLQVVNAQVLVMAVGLAVASLSVVAQPSMRYPTPRTVRM